VAAAYFMAHFPRSFFYMLRTRRPTERRSRRELEYIPTAAAAAIAALLTSTISTDQW
jgi:hypothetical protein